MVDSKPVTDSWLQKVVRPGIYIAFIALSVIAMWYFLKTEFGSRDSASKVPSVMDSRQAALISTPKTVDRIPYSEYGVWNLRISREPKMVKIPARAKVTITRNVPMEYTIVRLDGSTQSILVPDECGGDCSLGDNADTLTIQTQLRGPEKATVLIEITR